MIGLPCGEETMTFRFDIR